MKKRITLLTMTLLLAVVAVQAVSVTRQIALLPYGNNTKYGITWDANSCTIESGKITFTNGSFNKPSWTFATPVNISELSYTLTERTAELTFEIMDKDNNYAYYHWFGTDTGTRSGLKSISDTEKGSCDFTKIKKIQIDSRTNETTKYATFSDISLTIEVDGYDEVINTYEKNSFTLSDANFSNTLWGASAENVVNTSTGQITYQNSGNAVGWHFSSAIDLTQYDRLVVKVHPQSVTFSGDWWVGVSLFLDVAGKGDNEVYMEKWNSAINNEDSYFTREVDLTKTLKSGESHDGSVVSVSAVTRFRFRTEGAGLSFQIDEIYLEKDGEQYILRSNTAADKYGTICLPFTASKPSNATIYDVVGWAETSGSPSALYLEEVNAMFAGKAYIFKSGDTNDITFTKTDTEDNLTDPVASTNMLHGQFSGEAYVTQNSYILSNNTWKKVVKENTNKVKNYRAFLTLRDDLKVTTPPKGARVMDFDGDGGVTGISAALNDNGQMTNDSYFDLSGRRVAQPTKKGIYVKNGKKYIVK